MSITLLIREKAIRKPDMADPIQFSSGTALSLDWGHLEKMPE